MEQGTDDFETAELPMNIADIDYVLLTHAHIDHSGMLPLLYARGFRGDVIATPATVDLCDIMLKDSAHIQMTEAEWKNRKGQRAGKEPVVPIYDMNDAEGVLEHFVSCDYDKVMDLCEGVKVKFSDAGHLLGSASIKVWINEDGEERKIVFREISVILTDRLLRILRILMMLIMLLWNPLMGTDIIMRM